MKLISLFFLVFISLLAWGRKPAVEDFVGMELPEQKVVPSGTEPLFNLENDLKNHSTTPPKTAATTIKNNSPLSPGVFLIGLSFLMLPVGIYVLLITKLKRQSKQEALASVESLSDFRRKNETSDKIKKAS